MFDNRTLNREELGRAAELLERQGWHSIAEAFRGASDHFEMAVSVLDKDDGK